MAKESEYVSQIELAHFFQPLKNHALWLMLEEEKFEDDILARQNLRDANAWIDDPKATGEAPSVDPILQPYFEFTNADSILESIRVAVIEGRKIDKHHIFRFKQLRHYLPENIHNSLLKAMKNPYNLDQITKEIYNSYGVATELQDMQLRQNLLVSRAKPSLQ